LAKRPVFLPGTASRKWVIIRDVEFTWHAGLAPSQKRKSIASLHTAALAAGIAQKLLEISTKSPDDAGVSLSAFNLSFSATGWPSCSVEAAFQSSKVFEGGGPFKDIAVMTSMDAKRDARLHSSGKLIAFDFQGELWSLLPRTAFYDWLYIHALLQNPALAEIVTIHDAFTDIEFNPDKSINCQAHAAALFVALTRSGTLLAASASPEGFLSVLGPPSISASAHQERLL